MKILTLLNEKGGVGKTTLAFHIGAGLAIMGQRVLMIDMDPQGSLTECANIPKAPGVYNWLQRRELIHDLRAVVNERCFAGKSGNTGELHLLPGNIETRVLPMVTQDPYMILDGLIEVEDRYDIVVLDTPPTPTLMHVAIHMATDLMLYPVVPSKLPILGLVASWKHRKRAMQMHHRRAPMGYIIPNMYDDRILVHDKGMRAIERAFQKQVWQPMPKRTEVEKAIFDGKTVWAWDPRHEASDLMWRVVGRAWHELKEVS